MYLSKLCFSDDRASRLPIISSYASSTFNVGQIIYTFSGKNLDVRPNFGLVSNSLISYDLPLPLLAASNNLNDLSPPNISFNRG